MSVKSSKKVFIATCTLIDFAVVFCFFYINKLEIAHNIILPMIIIEGIIYIIGFQRSDNMHDIEIEKLYRGKKNKYKKIYAYISKLYNEKDVESKLYIRSTGAMYASNKITLSLLGTMITLITLLFDNFRSILIALVKWVCTILNYNENVNYNEIIDYDMIENNTVMFIFIVIIFLLFLFFRILHSVNIQTYVIHVIEDVERDRSIYDSHGISSNKEILKDLES